MKNTIFTFDFEESESEDPFSRTEKGLESQKQSLFINKVRTIYFFDDQDQKDGQIPQEEEEEVLSLKSDQQSSDQQTNPKGVLKQKNSYTIDKRTSMKPKQIFEEENDCEEINKNQKNNIFVGLEIKEKDKSKLEYISEKKALKVTDIRKFLVAPLGDYKIRAIIKKINSGFLNTTTKFQIFIEQNNRFLFSVLRDGLSQYVFSLSKENINTKNKNYLGLMQCNVFGTQFQFYDHGFSPKQTRSLEHCRKQMSSIIYESNKGPRKFQAVVSTNSQGIYALEPDRNALQELWNNKKKENISKLYSQSPEYDPEEGNYKLDFKGIVKKASIKNFILGGNKWKDTLIFGKIDDETFIMEIKEPLSILQAAAISISSIHYKLK